MFSLCFVFSYLPTEVDPNQWQTLFLSQQELRNTGQHYCCIALGTKLCRLLVLALTWQPDLNLWWSPHFIFHRGLAPKCDTFGASESNGQSYITLRLLFYVTFGIIFHWITIFIHPVQRELFVQMCDTSGTVQRAEENTMKRRFFSREQVYWLHGWTRYVCGTAWIDRTDWHSAFWFVSHGCSSLLHFAITYNSNAVGRPYFKANRLFTWILNYVTALCNFCSTGTFNKKKRLKVIENTLFFAKFEYSTYHWWWTEAAGGW